MKRFFLFLLTLLPFATPAQRELSFAEEYIDFSIGKSGFETNGVYLFVNNTDRKLYQEIRFPFAVGTDSIEIQQLYNLSEQKKIAYKTGDKSISFAIAAEPRDTVQVNVNYRQKLLRNNVYILRSTMAWGEPLQIAKYTLTVHDDLEIESTSYPYDVQKENVMYWERRGFMPEKNFEVILK